MYINRDIYQVILLYIITGSKVFNEIKENDKEYLNNFVDIIYHLNNESLENYFSYNNKYINNTNLNNIKDIIINKKESDGLIYSIQKDYYETKKWRGIIDVKKAWNIKMDILKKIQHYHDPINDQIHMDRILDEPSYISSIHACMCFLYNWDKEYNCNENKTYFLNKYNKNQISLKIFIKELTSYGIGKDILE